MIPQPIEITRSTMSCCGEIVEYLKFEDGSVVEQMTHPNMSKLSERTHWPVWSAAEAYLCKWDWSPKIQKESYADYCECMNLVHQTAARIYG